MSKDFRAAGGQEKSCAINRLKSLKEYESLDFRLKHSQRATVNNVTVQRVQTEGTVQRKVRSAKRVLVISFSSNWSNEEHWHEHCSLFRNIQFQGIPRDCNSINQQKCCYHTKI